MVRNTEVTGEGQQLSPVLTAAITYAARGWQLIPLHSLDAGGHCTCRKGDCTAPGKHPRTEKGLKDASSDPAVLDAWWRSMYPSANIAVVTGASSGVVGLDIDPRHGGEAGLAALIRDIGVLPETLTAKTGGGGLHLFFKHPGIHLKNAKELHGYTGVDFKGDNGYLVLSPSTHASGNRYEWANETDVAPLPPGLLPLVKGTGQLPELDSLGSDGFVLNEGQRNNALTSLAGAMRRKGSGYSEIYAALSAANTDRTTTPLLQREIALICKSVCRYQPDAGEAPNPSQPRRGGLQVVTVEQMLATPDAEHRWLVDGLLNEGGISVVSAKPKTGKSTWMRNLALAVSRGESFMGRPTRQGKVLYLSIEEIESEIRGIFRAMGVTTEPIYIHVGMVQEKEALADMEAYIVAQQMSLVIVDPLFKLMNSVRDIINYTEVQNAMARLGDVARRTGCHISSLHHNKKGGWQTQSDDEEDVGTEAVSGSNAIPASADTTILMRRLAGGRRVVRSQQRYHSKEYANADMPDTVVGFDPNTHLIRVEGSMADVKVLDCQEAVLDAVGDDTISEVEIRNLVGYNDATVAQAIRSLVVVGRLARVNGNVTRYKIPVSQGDTDEDEGQWMQL